MRVNEINENPINYKIYNSMVNPINQKVNFETLIFEEKKEKLEEETIDQINEALDYKRVKTVFENINTYDLLNSIESFNKNNIQG